jgi:hypothetical protein
MNCKKNLLERKIFLKEKSFSKKNDLKRNLLEKKIFSQENCLNSLKKISSQEKSLLKRKLSQKLNENPLERKVC